MPSQSPLERQCPLALHHELHTKRQAAVPLGGWPLNGVEHSPDKDETRKKMYKGANKDNLAHNALSAITT
jgi:hypothetical protein